MARCINPDEARRHQKALQQMVNNFLKQIGLDEPGECFKIFTNLIKNQSSKLVHEVGEAKVDVVLASIKDPTGLALRKTAH